MSIDVNVQNDLVIVTESSEDITVNVSNAAGPAGVGVPTGGSTGQVLKKLTGTNYDTYWAAEGGGVPYSGASGNVDLGEYELKAGQIEFDQTPTGTASTAVMRWNDTTGVSETTLKGGNVVLKNGVDLVARVVNKVTPNTTLTKAAYQAVKISGAQGQRLAVALAQANNDAGSADTIGLVTETIAANQEGFIMTVGQLEGINTTGSLQGETWADGDVLYLSPTTAGAITKVKPTGATGHLVIIGYVEYAHANNGKIYVKITNGFELEELHDVAISNPLNDQVLTYESSTQLWKNKTATGGGNIYTADGTLTGNRIVTMGANTLTFNGTSGSAIRVAYTDATNGTPPIQGTFGAATGLLQLVADGSGNSLLQNNFASLIFRTGSTPANALVINSSKVSRFYADIIFNNISSALQFDDGTSGWGGKISSNGGTGALELTARFSTAPITFITSNGTNNVVSEKARLTAAGRLLLGTTTESTFIFDAVGNARITGNLNLNASASAWSSGFRVIEMQGGATIASFTSTPSAQILTNLYNDGLGLIRISATFGTRYYQLSGQHVFEVTGSGSAGSSATMNTAMTLTNAGRLLLGTTTESTYLLDVNGTARVSGQLDVSNTASPTLKIQHSGSNANTTRLAIYGPSFTPVGQILCAVGANDTGFNAPLRNSSAVIAISGYWISTNNAGAPGITDIALYAFQSKSVSFNSVTEYASAQVAIDSTTKGFLPPRGTNAQMLAIASPATGLMFYDTTNNKLNCYDGTTWQACW